MLKYVLMTWKHLLLDQNKIRGFFFFFCKDDKYILKIIAAFHGWWDHDQLCYFLDVFLLLKYHRMKMQPLRPENIFEYIYGYICTYMYNIQPL